MRSVHSSPAAGVNSEVAAATGLARTTKNLSFLFPDRVERRMRGSAAKIVVSGARGAYDGAKIKGQIGSTPEGGGALMPHYITLFRFTQKGIENIKQGASRIDAGKKAIEAAGGKLKAFYVTLGQYDGIIIAEYPNDEAAAKLSLTTSALGNVRGETLRAFTEEEYRKLIASLP
jgi:uncharacterized protein with GYD domain